MSPSHKQFLAKREAEKVALRLAAFAALPEWVQYATLHGTSSVRIDVPRRASPGPETPHE